MRTKVTHNEISEKANIRLKNTVLFRFTTNELTTKSKTLKVMKLRNELRRINLYEYMIYTKSVSFSLFGVIGEMD